MMYTITAIVILVAYVFHLKNRIKSLRKRIDRLNREVDDGMKICNHHNRYSMELEDENDFLKNKLLDKYWSSPTLSDDRQAEIWNSITDKLNR